MAMRKRLWSVNAAAVELGRDRRTIAKALNGVAPDGQLHGHAAWHMDTIVEALTGGRTKEARSALRVPPGFRAVDGLENPLDQGLTIGLLMMVYRMGRLAAAAAVGAGAPMQVAFALHKLASLVAAYEAEDICRASNLPIGSGLKFDVSAFEEPDWAALAGMAGEEVDLAAWERWAAQHCSAA